MTFPIVLNAPMHQPTVITSIGGPAAIPDVLAVPQNLPEIMFNGSRPHGPAIVQLNAPAHVYFHIQPKETATPSSGMSRVALPM